MGRPSTGTNAVAVTADRVPNGTPAGKRVTRRRSGGSRRGNQTSKSEPSGAGPLAGHKVAITVLDSHVVEGHKGTGTAAEQMALLSKLGGVFSPTVHKRVSVVVASSAAVAARTQRVRKAERFGIPIVTPEWLSQCEAVTAWVDPKSAAWKHEPSHPSSGPPRDGHHHEAAAPDRAGAGAAVSEGDEDDATRPRWMPPQEWTACYCACHDKESGPGCCEWCVEGHPGLVAETSAVATGSLGTIHGSDATQITRALECATTPLARRMAARVRLAIARRFWVPTRVAVPEKTSCIHGI
mmetsp:Transcript_33807/g.88803  ORF Transcript_33807/g.88803 Transcript_33807/m.88803 type:complete len:296 (+) Transcript_33807:160-1047(+)